MARSEVRPTVEEVALAEEQIVAQSKRIDFFLTEYSVELLAQKVRDGEYVVPDYQREFTWDERRKSRFIESLIMGLPIPFIFFWEMPDGRLEIVDGSQRLRTIEEFVYGGLQLGELDPLTHLSGFRFDDLPESRQRKIKNRSVRGIVLNEHADEAARFDMFERINTSSMIANNAEIRRGALKGPFLDVVTELANSPLLAQLAPLPAKTRRERGYEELVTRLFAYGDGLAEYRDRPADFLFAYSKRMNSAFAADPTLADSYRQRFNAVLNFVSQNFPFGFRKAEKSTTTPRTRFESIAIGVDRALAEQPELADRSADGINVASWISLPEFQEITSADGANAIKRLRGRIDYVKNKLVGHGDD
ncbi:hypothetical protein BTO20_06760 [Mycobacterium dioxanotrophicus]|uniref:GmrSD restriction endonucleases N-terminal domain-containing protein n=1 Tax=Mycobacterium dioxanotrophicus TaxID=482462 RepID=A0A1Y0BZM0_9MYCO|nr:DUF262 domain-containing protein [Mycobacterium dioxanotrophicus]ART68324.1 hypothetical protein BTO20_06760 [Mycobacterium dioxanotrophicus]